jgi:hypothetical protein
VAKVSNTASVAHIQSGGSMEFRIEFISVLAAAIGLLAGAVAYALYNLIGLITNIAFYHNFSTQFRSPACLMPN